jgi:hypothetical protein
MQYSFGGTRTAAKPWGDGSRKSEVEANKVVKLCLQILWACIATGTGFSIENPRTSLLWLLSDFKDLLDLGFVDRCDFDMCCFGLCSPKGVDPKVFYKKPTTVIGTFENPNELRKICPKTHMHGSLARQEYFVLANGARLLKSRHAGCYTTEFSKALLRAIC